MSSKAKDVNNVLKSYLGPSITGDKHFLCPKLCTTASRTENEKQGAGVPQLLLTRTAFVFSSPDK